MKKFLVFLFSIVVVVCLSLTTYYFMRNNEIITIKTKEIYCNAGDIISVKSLGIDIKKANVSKKTTFDYNAGGENVVKYIEFDKSISSYIVSQESAGDVVLVIRTSNKKYPDFEINVHVGNGSLENPYYIQNESELSKIGSVYRLDKHFKLMNDITLTSNFSPIGYNSETSSWNGFSGTFNGNGHTLKGLTLTDIDSDSVGLFSSLNTNAQVKNLKLENISISGAHKNIGILAGINNGYIEKVEVKNSTITNKASNSAIGAMVGTQAGTIKMSYADSVKINIEGTEEVAIQNAKVGGFAGVIDKSTIQATYANNIEIIASNATVIAGGFAGQYIIGTEAGTIQQSYANTTSNVATFGAFLGEIENETSFNASKANMLRYLIGNIAIAEGKNSANITDIDLVNIFDKTFFKNMQNASRSVFYDNQEAALYLIRGFGSAGEVVSTNEYVFYAVDQDTKTEWDTDYVWNTAQVGLPTLRMGEVSPTVPSNEYFSRNLNEIKLSTDESINNILSSDIENVNIILNKDVLINDSWQLIAVKNSIIDGNNKTIKIALNDNHTSLFSVIDNSTIKNLNIVVTSVNCNNVHASAGALAERIISSGQSISTIENVNVTFDGTNFSGKFTNFGGIAGRTSNTRIEKCSVKNLAINSDAQIDNVGSIVGYAEETTQIKNIEVKNAIVSGIQTVGGIVGHNNGGISTVTGDVQVVSNSQGSARIGGVVANNNGSIDNIKLEVVIKLNKLSKNTYVGGVAAFNYSNHTISNVRLTGKGIVVTDLSTTNALYLGGVVSENIGSIENIVIDMINVGSYVAGANHVVGGIACVNSGDITAVVVESNINGNNVSGVVAKMDCPSALIDQVVVGEYNSQAKVLSQNTIKADKYVAGVVVDFKRGTIQNVQVSSRIEGLTNSTRSSLVTLIFNYGATLRNATVNSSFLGYGERYRETWIDFASYDNKKEFGLGYSLEADSRFNIYLADAHHGSMQSVVINGSCDGVNDAKYALGTSVLGLFDEYQNTSESSYIKIVDGFNDVSQFQGDFKFLYAKTGILGIKKTINKSLTFEILSIWESNNGISLRILNDLYA